MSSPAPASPPPAARPRRNLALTSLLSEKGRSCKALFLTPFSGCCEPPVLSPVTNLANNMNKLAGLGSNCDTPKRRPSGTPLLVKTLSSDSDAGLCMDSPSPLDEKEIDETFEKAILESGKVVSKKFPIRRINSLPLRLLGSSPALKMSQCDASDSEVFLQDNGGLTPEANKENEGFQFKKPVRPISRHRLCTFYGVERSDHRSNSAPELMFSPCLDKGPTDSDSPVLRRSSLTSSINDDDDDGFLELLDEDIENRTDLPSGMESLLTAPLVTKKFPVKDASADKGSPNKLPCGLFRSPSLPCYDMKPILKRVDRPQDEETPVKNKRRRSLAGAVVEEKPDDEKPKQRSFMRSKSFCDTTIEKVMEIGDCRHLIGDFTKSYILPTVEGRHQDLRYITPEMMAQLVTGKFSGFIERFMLIDCRYPYEYDGGHIKDALNLHMEEELENYLLKTPIVPLDQSKRVIVIFHCEFSSERGPRMCRFLREKDRDLNGTNYPKLHYPELYILKGGYREFFPNFKIHCEPQSYRPMHHEDFKDDLRQFRVKSRTWAGERSKRDMYSRLKKL
ncbi:M-phase inducer phosphatase 2 [Callorhinchus milii]|uniref:M-phase inducer phosphatase n=1 Tax=Callorhinchus milii TaxID=7868 RepID=A0A4W3IJJ0_CALMI|nr:M-phase inducer phosphatase 2 [Callorhinchus milii]|eukprot:gi/632960514/ref/XP_007896237.1/ PREDICTED: M-phase inducer phosphatase 1-like [Callorhinchus milii]